MNRAAARASAALSVLFLAVYGGCNWITAQRSFVGTWYFDWERHMPFVRAMVVPYLSIDLFFVGAPFLCGDRDELDLLVRRVTGAVVVAGACFLAMPLRFAFPPPEVSGRLGAAFDLFRSVDRPFNMFPSLHVALAAILIDTYSRHTRGLTRVAVRVWFALIVLSTVLTYQHHVVDVAGGFALAVLVFYWPRKAMSRRLGTPHLKIASYYLLAAAVTAAAATVAWPWTSVLLWPAVSFAIVAAGYLGAGAGVFRKTDGRIALSARVLTWPYLAGQWLSLAYYRRQCGPYDEVVPGILIGRRLSEREAVELTGRGVTAVLDLTAEFGKPHAFSAIAYKNIPVLDLTAPTVTELRSAVAYIRDRSTKGVVYVHCKIGYSRTAAAVGAYLLAAGLAKTADEAVAMLRRARPTIVVRTEAYDSLRRFAATPRKGGARDEVGRSAACRIVASVLALVARAMCGTSPQWAGCEPRARQRIYFANHSSHLDFLVLWASLPPEIRARTRPVAGRDYWDRTRVRRYLARRIFRAVLIDRRTPASAVSRDEAVAGARQNIERTAAALSRGDSLIIFPEGTRGDGREVAPFKSGLYHLCVLRPDVELVPAWLENLNRIMPKGEAIPVPLVARATFGRPLRLEPGEEKDAFLARARSALMNVSRPCTCLSTAISPA